MLMKNKLISDLQKKLSSSNVLSQIEERYSYAYDASGFKDDKCIPDVVVFVENTEQVQEVVKLANKYKTPIICRGAGTNVVGACTALHGGIILNFSKMNRIIKINPENMTAIVEPGVVLGDLQNEVEKFGLFYPPDPSNLAVSTIGGSIAQNSGGAKSFKYGTTKDYIVDLKVVMADGSILRTGANTIKNSTGYNLNTLFAGSEGTLGIVVEATLKLIPKPESKKVFMAYFDSVKEAVSAVGALIEQRIHPAAIDFMDKKAIQTVERFYPANLLTDKEAALVIEIDGFECSMKYQEDIILGVLKNCKASAIQASHNDEEYDRIWFARRSSMESCSKIKPDVTTDDVIVPRENLSELVLGIRSICEKYDLDVCMIGHVGDGSVHPQIPINFEDKDEYRRYKLAKEEMYQLTADLGGLISGEHGIGLEKREFIDMVLSGVTLDYMRKIKKIFDPNNILNPYKIF